MKEERGRQQENKKRGVIFILSDIIKAPLFGGTSVFWGFGTAALFRPHTVASFHGSGHVSGSVQHLRRGTLSCTGERCIVTVFCFLQHLVR